MYNNTNFKQEIIEKAWADISFKNELLENPRQAIEKTFEMYIPGNVEVKVLEETKDVAYLVLPVNVLETNNEAIPACVW